jgi:hypothetical protein
MFAREVRTGHLAADGRPVRKRTVEQYLRSVAQIFASVGAPDPRHDASGTTDFRLSRQFRTYDKQDPPPTRVRPVPLQLLVHMYDAVAQLHDHATERQRAVADLAIMAFFFLLRPGEYCKSGPDTESHPFRLQDVTFCIGDANYNAATAPLDRIRQADYTALYFTTQKNGVRGEAIGHGASGHPTACPLRVIRRRVLYLRSLGAPPDTPLCAVLERNRWRLVPSTAITAALRASCTAIGDTVGLKPGDISARALRAGGAMALLLGKVDYATIQLIGRWRSDQILRYLHVSARPIMQCHARIMTQNSAFRQFPTPTIDLVD